jgi:hypothetical protein
MILIGYKIGFFYGIVQKNPVYNDDILYNEIEPKGGMMYNQNNGYKKFNRGTSSKATHLIGEIEQMLREFNGTMLPHDKSYFDFCLKNAGVNGLTVAKEKLQDLIDNPRNVSLLVVGGNTYPYKDTLKAMGFKLGKVQGQWVNYAPFCSDLADSVNQDFPKLFTFKTDSLDAVLPKLAEAKKKSYETNADEPHKLDGKVLEVTKWYGNIVKEEFGLEVIFRNIRIKKVHRETAKAFEVDFELFGGIARCCGICGRQLDNEISKASGIGPVCATKLGFPRPTLESAKEIQKMLEEKFKQSGVIEKKWVPKSQVTVLEVE